MKFNLKFISLLLVIFFISLAFVSATDVDSEISTEDSNGIAYNGQLTIADETNNQILEDVADNNGKHISPHTFTELKSELSSVEENDVIYLDSDCDYDTGFNPDGIQIKTTITIDGNGHSLNGKDSGRMFFIDADNVVLKNINFINGKSSNGGGAILVRSSNLIIDNCTFTNNKDTGYGGAIFINEFYKTDSQKATSGNTIKNSKFVGNTAENGGGAIYSLSKATTVQNSVFEDNKANKLLGGAVFVENSDNKIIGNTFTNNVATKDGGALALQSGTNQLVDNNVFTKNSGHWGGAINLYQGGGFTIINNVFDNNDATDLGGAMRLAITNSNILTKIENNSLKNNNAPNGGGAIYIDGSNTQINNNNFYNNKATVKSGGAINIHGSSNTIANNIIDKSSAKFKGGAIYLEGNANKINDNTITNSYAENGGGAVYVPGATTSIIGNTFKNNKADGIGGAIQLEGDKLTIDNNILSDNIAKTNGGALYINSKNPTISNNKFTANKGISSESAGGAIRIYSDNAVINKNTFEKNTATYGSAIFGTGNNQQLTGNTYVNSKESDEVIWKGNKLQTSLTVPTKTYVVTVNPKSITATLKDSNGKVVSGKQLTFTVDGKTYTGTTNEKGVATIKATLTTVKSYPVTVTFKGDSNYESTTATGTVKVTKEKTKITAPNKTFKKAAKTKKVTITLKSNSNKALAKKKVTLKVNGKTYSAKTNAKGQASINVKLTKKGTFKYTATFNGDSEFEKSSKTGSIIIK